jgi:hypothetical protein
LPIWLLLQQPAQQQTDGGIVVSDQDTGRHSHTSPEHNGMCSLLSVTHHWAISCVQSLLMSHILAGEAIQQIPDPVTTLIPGAARPIASRIYPAFLRDTRILFGSKFKLFFTFF